MQNGEFPNQKTISGTYDAFYAEGAFSAYGGSAEGRGVSYGRSA